MKLAYKFLLFTFIVVMSGFFVSGVFAVQTAEENCLCSWYEFSDSTFNKYTCFKLSMVKTSEDPLIIETTLSKKGPDFPFFKQSDLDGNSILSCDGISAYVNMVVKPFAIKNFSCQKFSSADTCEANRLQKIQEDAANRDICHCVGDDPVEHNKCEQPAAGKDCSSLVDGTYTTCKVEKETTCVEKVAQAIGKSVERLTGGGEKEVTPPTAIATNAKTLNKLTLDNSIPKLLGRIISVAMGILGSIALAMVVYGGLLMMLSAGNAERSKKGTQILIWAGLGVIVIFASYALVDLVFEIFR